MKTQQDLFSYLDSLGISHSTVTHEPLFTVQDRSAAVDALPGAHCKNLFLKDDNKQFWLLVALQHTQIKLKPFGKSVGAPNLRFAKEDMLKKYLGVTPGAVTPFGLINDQEHAVRVVVDQEIFKHAVVNFHPLVNTATTTISADDFKKFLASIGNNVQIVDLSAIAQI